MEFSSLILNYIVFSCMFDGRSLRLDPEGLVLPEEGLLEPLLLDALLAADP